MSMVNVVWLDSGPVVLTTSDTNDAIVETSAGHYLYSVNIAPSFLKLVIMKQSLPEKDVVETFHDMLY